VCDLETSRVRRPWPALGRSATGKKSDNLERVTEKNEQVYFNSVFFQQAHAYQYIIEGGETFLYTLKLGTRRSFTLRPLYSERKGPSTL